MEKNSDETGKEPVRLSAEELAILDYTHQFGSVTLSNVIDIHRIPRRTAQRRLQTLVSKGILEKFNQGPATQYRILARSK